MSLVLVVPEFPKVSETFIAQKVEGLLQKGVVLKVVCQKSALDQWAYFPHLNRKLLKKSIYVLPPFHSKELSALLFPFIFLKCLFLKPMKTLRYLSKASKFFGLKGLKKFYQDSTLILAQPSCIHYEFGALAKDKMYLKDFLNCKVSVSFRGYDINYVGLDKMDYYKSVWEVSDHLHFLGRDLWKRAVRRGCPKDKQYALIAPAIDSQFFVPNAQKSKKVSDKIRILSVGRLEWKKGYEFALQAIQILKEKGLAVEYRIVGAGSYLESIAFARYQLGLEKEVFLLGALNREKVREQMQEADVFLHAAISEGFCNAVLEAQAMELPVVCTDADGLSENIADGKTGFVVPRRNAKKMADKVFELSTHPELCRQFGQAGRQRILESFQIEKQIKAFQDFYAEVSA